MIRSDMDLVENGNQKIAVYYKYDDEKPKCWVEGFEYKFNKQIIFMEVITPVRKKDERE